MPAVTPVEFIDGPGMLLGGLRRQHSVDDAGPGLRRQWEDFRAQAPLPGRIGAITYGVICGHSDNHFEYLCGVEVASLDTLPAGAGRMRLLPQYYAVFRHEGPVDQLGDTWRHVFDWLATSGYSSAHAPDFEVYTPGAGHVEILVAVAPGPAWRIRPEDERDRAAVHGVNVAAFDTSAEARLVDNLRLHAHPLISLVAERQGRILGHVLFSPVTLEGHPGLMLMGLAPMAVAPGHQRRGIGSALVQAGLARCRALGADAVVVLGHVEYYPRFGFVPAARLGIGCEYGVPAEAFMVLELKPGSLKGASGTVRYHHAFGDL